MTRVRAGSLMVVGALAGAVLAGCDSSADADPTSSPSTSATDASPSTSAGASESPSPSPSASASASESGPDIPAAARKKTDAGAEAFIRYYFKQMNRAWTTPKSGLLPPLSTADCEFCKKNEDRAVALVKQQLKYSTSPVSVATVETFGGAPEGQQYLHLVFRQYGSKIVDESGATVGEDPKALARTNAALVWSSEGWKLRGVEKAQ